MKKKLLAVTILMLLLSCLVIFSACGGECKHRGGTATCTEQAICKKCGEHYGDLLEHTWQAATCSTPKTCTVCGAAEGDLVPHTMVGDTCTVCKGSTAGLKYTLNTAGTEYSVAWDKTTEITKVIILATYNDLPVTSIAKDGFIAKDGKSGCKTLTLVTIPNGIISIGAKAFFDCTGIVSITIPATVTSIGNSAFLYCSSLASIAIPDNVSAVGDSALLGTEWYRNQLSGVVYVGKVAYSYKGSIPSSGEVVLREGTTGIAASAFNGRATLTKIVLPNTVKDIGDKAFYYCGELKSMDIPASVTNIGEEAFWKCAKMETLTFNEGLETIGENAFRGCLALKSITLPNSVTTVAAKAFRECTGVETLVLGNGITAIGTNAFELCEAITTLTTGNGLTSVQSSHFPSAKGIVTLNLGSEVTTVSSSILEQATLTTINVSADNATFMQIDGNLYSKDGTTLVKLAAGKALKTFDIPTSVTALGASAFANCDSLTYVIVPSRITNIARTSFSGCAALNILCEVETAPDTWLLGWNGGRPVFMQGAWQITSQVLYTGNVAFCFVGEMPANAVISILAGTEKIEKEAFAGYVNLKSITLPDGLTEIGESAFAACTNLESINIPSSVTKIEKNVFTKCSKLASITLPIGVTVIEEGLFNGCTSLTSCTLGTQTAEIKKDAFSSCVKLASIVLPSTLTELGENAFANCRLLNNVTLPASLLELNKATFAGCTALTSITIPTGTTTLPAEVFSGCTALATVVIPDSVLTIGNNAFAQTDWYNKQEDGLVYIGKVAYRYKGTMTEQEAVIIKEGTRSIAQGAFEDCALLTGITIPNSVEIVGANAFKGCVMLETIDIDIDVTPAMFAGCGAITTIKLGKNVENIGDSFYITKETVDDQEVLSGVLYLTSITVDEENETYSSVDGVLYNKAGDTIILYPVGKTEVSLTIDETITAIGKKAFYGATSLVEVIIHEQVTAIGENAFGECSKLSIFCYAESRPTGWKNTAGSEWNGTCEVYFKEDWTMVEGVPTPIEEEAPVEE